MPRLLSILLVVGLLGGTAAAFAVTEGLKLRKSPILGTVVTPKAISPVCGCPTGKATIAFRLRHADHLTIRIQDSSGRSVRTLVSNRDTADGPQEFSWNGRLADGRVAPDGAYRANLELDDADRSITLPNRIGVDTTKPHVLSVGVDLLKTRVVVRYRASEPAHGILYVGGKRVVFTYRSPKVGRIEISRLSLQERAATGRLAVAVSDRAGNRSKVRVLHYVIGRRS